MKTRWLNLILRLTNRIYTRKKDLVSEPGVKIIIIILQLILLEILLAIVSLPLYIGMKAGGVTAYLEEKGGYAKVSFDYNLRRILTLSGVGIFFLIWIIKLILILAVPTVYGPLRLYNVSSLQPIDIFNKELVSTETAVQTARIVKNLIVPEITKAEKGAGGSYTFFGTGQPNTDIILLLSDKQTAIYREVTDKQGNWQVKHDQKTFKLATGAHSLLAFTYDQKNGTRSDVSQEQYFRTTTTWVDTLTNYVDVLANWSIIIIIALGVFLTFLTI